MRAGAVVHEVRAHAAGPGWLYGYLALQIGCQLALLSETLAPARVLFRSMAFGVSLLWLVVIPGRPAFRHPALGPAVAVLAILTFSAFNPDGSTLVGVLVHWAFYLAVLAPVFWVMRLEVTESTLGRLIMILWIFGTMSSVVGILQVYFPGQFQPAMSTAIRRQDIQMIHLASGAWVVRPMGLTDAPGGVASAGFDATLFGLYIVLTRPFRGATVTGVVSMVVGLASLYLSQIRALLVTLGVCCIALLGMFAATGRLSRLVSVLALGALAALLGFQLAYFLAGDQVSNRLASLVADNPATVYHANRGRMVEWAFNELLPQYPLGAGLGRWGMVHAYFGDGVEGVPAEVQWAGWIADGGLLLILAYPIAILVGIGAAVRAALTHAAPTRALMAGLIAAHGIGTLALTFSFAVFMSSAGVQFWLLNALLLRVCGPLAVNHTGRV